MWCLAGSVLLPVLPWTVINQLFMRTLLPAAGLSRAAMLPPSLHTTGGLSSLCLAWSMSQLILHIPERNISAVPVISVISVISVCHDDKCAVGIFCWPAFWRNILLRIEIGLLLLLLLYHQYVNSELKLENISDFFCNVCRSPLISLHWTSVVEEVWTVCQC